MAEVETAVAIGCAVALVVLLAYLEYHRQTAGPASRRTVAFVLALPVALLFIALVLRRLWSFI